MLKYLCKGLFLFLEVNIFQNLGVHWVFSIFILLLMIRIMEHVCVSYSNLKYLQIIVKLIF